MATIATKFRPSLTQAEIDYLISLLQSSPAHACKESLLLSLGKFSLKAKYGIVSASHVSMGRATLEDSLGFGSPAASDESLESLHSIWQTTPSVLSPAQLAKVAHYRYINDMMTPEEEAAHEAAS